MRYRIRGIGADGVTQQLSLDASDGQEAALQAKSLGVSVLSVKAERQWTGQLALFRSTFPLLLFCQELLALLNAGISLLEALETLTEKESRPEVKSVLTRVIQSLREGRTFSSALEQAPNVFPPLFCATVRASENAGGLGEALTRYVAYETQVDAVRKKLVSTLIYPVTLMAAGLLVLVFLLGYVVPRFSQVYADMGNGLPWLTLALLQWGQLIERYGYVVLALTVTVSIAGWRWLSTAKTRRVIATLLWKMPAIGTRLQTHQLARFYRTLSMLLRGGMAVAPSLRLVSGLLSPAMRSRLPGAQAMINEGRSISEAMQANGLVTPVALRMLRVGERGGHMDIMMEKIADFHDEETARWIERFTKLFEPALMAVIGVVIGVVVLLMYMPVFELAGNIQ